MARDRAKLLALSITRGASNTAIDRPPTGSRKFPAIVACYAQLPHTSFQKVIEVIGRALKVSLCNVAIHAGPTARNPMQFCPKAPSYGSAKPLLIDALCGRAAGLLSQHRVTGKPDTPNRLLDAETSNTFRDRVNGSLQLADERHCRSVPTRNCLGDQARRPAPLCRVSLGPRPVIDVSATRIDF